MAQAGSIKKGLALLFGEFGKFIVKSWKCSALLIIPTVHKKDP